MSTSCRTEAIPPDTLDVRPSHEQNSPLDPVFLLKFCRSEVQYQRISGPEAEDVAQDALVALWLRRVSVVNPLAYLRVVIRRTAARLRRSKWLSGRFEVTSPVEHEGRHDPWAYADLRIDSLRALSALSPPDRRLVAMVYEGHSFAQIGAVLGCSEGAERVRVLRLRRTLGSDA